MKQEQKHPSPITFAKKSYMPFFTLSSGTTEWNETGTWRYLRPRYVERVPACQHACPTSNDIEAWIRLFEGGKLAEAWEAATLENPFPGIMGRVCFHPCTEGCNRRELGGSVNIQMCERTLADARRADQRRDITGRMGREHRRHRQHQQGEKGLRRHAADLQELRGMVMAADCHKSGSPNRAYPAQK